MRKAVTFLILPGLLAGASAASAQGPEIGHRPVGCIIAGQYPKMTACFLPRGSVARGRVYFKPEAAPAWYYVEMKSDAPCYAGVLPKPTKKLIDTKVLYYVQVVDKAFAEAQTAEYDPIVVEKESDCKNRLPVAPISRTGPAGVFPSVPPGFAVGSGVSPTVLGIGGAAVVGGGVAIIVKGKPKTTPSPTPTPTGQPTPTPTPSPTPTATPTPPTGSPLSATCQAQPQSGNAPLTVAFATFPSGGTGTYEFAWAFGDGGTANRSNPTHTYTATGNYDAVVKVTSGTEEYSCSKTISVGTAPPPSFALTVAKAGTGAGTVTSSPAGISCGGTCTASFTSGTVVSLSPSATPGSVFAGWSGACTGTGACSVTMDAAKSVTATFNLGNFPLSLTKSGTGTGRVTSSPAGIDCGATCTFTFPGTTVVTLTPTPDPRMFFMGWSGACSGTGACSVTMDAAKTVDAKFEPGVTLQIMKETGTGFGTVTSNPPGINCNGGCGFQQADFGLGQVVVLTATADPGSTFTNWTMDCSGGTPTCTLTMSAARFVGVKFDALIPAPGAAPGSDASSSSPPEIVPFTSELRAGGGRGQVAVNGQVTLSAVPGVVRATMPVRRGENRVEAWLTEGSAAGVWRFELGDVVEPGSLAVQAGDVQVVTGDSVGFRVRGTAGERFVFTFRRRSRGREGER